jgi:tetratricopeptide (TPR) repeat protein
MYKNLKALAILILCMVQGGFAQELLNTLDVDQRSYSLYEQQQWKPLIKLAKSAKKQGIDFYYLQYRLGISYYELKKYRQAIPCFESVVEQSPEDKTALEYLYFAYLFSDRLEDARVLALTFDPSFREQLKAHNPGFLGGFGAEYKHYLVDDFTAPHAGTVTDLEQKVRQSLNYTNMSLTHSTRTRFSLFHAFSYLWGLNRVYDATRLAHEFDENLRQFQYYIAGNWHLGKGFDMTLGGHYIRTTLEGLNPIFSPGPGPGNHNFQYLYITKENSWAGFLKFKKSLSNFNVRVSGTFSDLNGGMQYLPSAGIDYYPLGNTRLFISSDVSYLVSPDEERYNPGLVLKGKIGLQIFKPVWLVPFGQFGKVSDYADEDAFVIYNSHDVINHWYGVRLNVYLSNYKLNLYYIFQSYDNTNHYQAGGGPQQIGYRSMTHLAGLKWRIR